MEQGMLAKTFKRICAFILAMSFLFSLMPTSIEAQAKKVRTVRLGESISVAKTNAKYKSSDNSVAYVGSDGRVTAKKLGTAVITVKRAGVAQKIPIEVVANQKKKSIKVSAGEIEITVNKTTYVNSNVKATTEAATEQTTTTETTAETTMTENKEQTSATTSVSSSDATAVVSGNAYAGLTEVTEAPALTLTTQETTTQETTTQTETTQEVTTQAPAKTVSNQFTCTVTIKNVSDKAADKVVLVGKLNGKKYTFKSGKLKSGATKTFTVKGTTTKTSGQMSFSSLAVTSNKMINTYNYTRKSTKLDYATADKTAPKISGFIGENSYNESIPYRIVYSDDKDFDYFKYITVTDNRDVKVDVKVDTSKVNFNKTGTYTITYIATDKAGNKTKAKAKIGVRVPTTLDSMCDTILKRITKSNWSDTAKARAIYNYTRGHISYTGYSDKSSWEQEAINGIRYGTGDCFTYYAVSRALLTRAGIPNIEVKRVKPDWRGHTRHWWNMVYVQGGFYHFDTCPSSRGGRFCLITDSQLKEHSRTHGNGHIWAYSKKPKSATRILSHT